MPTSNLSTANANSDDIFDAVTASDPQRPASPGITLAQSSNGYHGDMSSPTKGLSAQPPLIVSPKSRPWWQCDLLNQFLLVVSLCLIDGPTITKARVSLVTTQNLLNLSNPVLIFHVHPSL
jgi:hypothetical protein